jgi:serine/threonine protein kinase
MLFVAGKLLGPYEILEPIGAGGMGEVYRARDRRLGRDVAIKVVRADLLGDAQRLRRFQQEARAAAAFHHPNICILHEIGESDGHHFIVMEYVEGRPLGRLISSRPLAATQIIDLAIQMAEALEEARSKGVVHRDIKPSNILVTAKGQVKILDFGLAKTALAPQADAGNATVTEPMTQAGMVMGTVPYMSPEQALGLPVDHRSDLFSLGIVLYEMGTGRRPFEGSTTMAVLNEIINKTPAPPGALNPEFPVALEPVLRKSLEKDRELRYQTAGDLVSDLKRLRRDAESGENAATVTAGLPSQLSARRSSPTIPILGAILVAAAGVWLGFFRDAGRGPAEQPATVYKLTQITRDSGLTYQPSISADGNFVAYASDRATGKDLDIWLQHVSGGQPVRLTSTPGDESNPSLSADGRKVAFEGSGKERGIFVVPALGGTPRLVAPAGNDAQISPDGASVAYSTGWYMQPSEIHIVSAEGGSDRKVSTDLDHAMAPLWTPDGRHLLLWASRSQGLHDYWMVPAAGGAATKTGTTERLQSLGARSMLQMPFSQNPSPVASVAGGGVVIAARSGDGHDLWLSPLSGDKGASKAVRITVGAGAANPSAAANGRIAFARLSVGSGLWTLPLEGASGRVSGEMRRVWRENVSVAFPNVSRDGKKLAYVSNRTGNPDVWVRDLESGEDRQLTSSKVDEFRALISPDGTRVAFVVGEGEIHTMPSGGGVESSVVCEKCGNVHGWSPDGGKLLSNRGNPIRFTTVDLTTGQVRDVVRHPTADIHSGRISPDGRWITFTVVTAGSRVIYVASLDDGGGGKPESWIRISGEGPADSSFWSPDGNLLYISQGGALWARRLRPDTKAPIGEAFVVQRFDGTRYRPNFSANPVTKDALYFTMQETTANIWLAEPSAP